MRKDIQVYYFKVQEVINIIKNFLFNFYLLWHILGFLFLYDTIRILLLEYTNSYLHFKLNEKLIKDTDSKMIDFCLYIIDFAYSRGYFDNLGCCGSLTLIAQILTLLYSWLDFIKIFLIFIAPLNFKFIMNYIGY